MSKTCPHCGNKHDEKAAKCEKCGKPMEKAAEGDHLEEGAILEGDALSPIIEAQTKVIVPKRGKLFEERDGLLVGKLAVIRPCMSRGARIRGLQPIYERAMLAENAAVFSGWQMYADHSLVEALAEKLQERGRSIREIGSRLLKTWFDPDLVFEDDSERGYQKGGVVGEYVPQPFIREMLEADPYVIESSINAWPTRVRVGRPSWDSSKKGAIVEGISGKPPGSVDWVPRGGAGGRPLSMKEEDRQLAVSILESTYPSPRDGNPKEPHEMPKKKLSEMSAEEVRKLPKTDLVSLLKEEGGEAVAESVAEAVALGDSGGNGGSGGEGNRSLTEERVAEMLTEQERKLREGFDESLKEARKEGDKELREKEDARSLEAVAHEVLSEAHRNGFPQAWVDQLKPRYTVTSTAIGSGLKLSESDLSDGEGQEVKPEAAMRERVKADIEESIKLMEAAGGKPRVKGFGATAPDPQGEGKGKGGEGKKPNLVREADDDAFIGFLVESGDITGDPDKDSGRLSEIVGGR